jgi:outer membrane protein assembly factor BamB
MTPDASVPETDPLPAAIQHAAVITQHNDNARTGANLLEKTLNVHTVTPSRFGLLFSRQVQGLVFAQPLYVPAVDLGSRGVRDLVIVATEHNLVYAFDATHADANEPLWSVQLGPPMPAADLIDQLGIVGEIGITSTPVIDLATRTIYVVAQTKESGEYVQRLHALALEDGSERPASPIALAASVPGGAPDSIRGQLALNTYTALQRVALTESNGAIFIAEGGHGDQAPWHGWVLAYDAATLQPRGAHTATPNGFGGGIWQAGQGLAVDVNGSIYYMSGNGPFAPSMTNPDLSDSIVKLRLSASGLAIADWFTPFNQESLNLSDGDLGSAGVVAIPNTDLVVGGGKEGKLYVLDVNAMGHNRPNADDQIRQSFMAVDGIMHSAPVWWNGPDGGRLYVAAELASIKGYRFRDGKFDTTPFSTSAFMADAILSLSSDGSARETGILWSAQPLVDNGDGALIVPGKLSALDADDLTRELWTSEMKPEDAVGLYSKYCAPTIADGRVYLATFSGKLQVYGLR